MTTITWTGKAGDGNFNNPANWSPMQVPGSGDNAVITPAAATVISAGNDTVGALTLSKTVTLQVANNSTFDIGNGSTATTFSNAGTLALESGGNSTGLIVNSPTLTLTGGGLITTSDEGGSNYFAAASSGEVLDNVNNTFDVSGNFGNNSGLVVINSGTIDAGQANTLTLQLAATLTNKGLIEATAAGGIVINGNTTIDNAGGTIMAKASAISLDGGTIEGGTLSSTGTGSFYINNGILDGATAGAITSSAAIQIDNNNVLYALGTLTNSGTITLASGGNSTGFIVDSAKVTLNGGGVVTTSDEGGNNYFQGAASGDTLVNADNTLNLSGNFGNGQLAFTNYGTVDADQANTLTFNLGEAFINNALVEATGAGGIVIDSNTTINNAAGSIAAKNSAISLNGGTIEGGKLSSTGTGSFYINGGILDGATAGAINSSAAIQVDNNNVLYAIGTLTNTGTITLASGGNSTGFIVDGTTVTLNGGGVITSSDEGGDNYFQGAAGGDTLINVDNTLNLSGNFGNGQLAFTNDGTVDANQTHALTFNLGEAFTNNALVEETGTGGIVVDGNTTISNGSKGIVAATGSGGISLNSGTIAGGTLTSGKGGGFYSNNGTLDGSSNTIISKATIQVDNNNVVYVLGTLTNSGVITLDSGGNSTGFIVDSAKVTLNGGGVITSSDEGGDNYFAAATSGEVLDNVNNTLNLSGNFGNGSGLIVTNTGVIDANQTHALVIENGALFTNDNLLEETGTGGLVISGSNTVSNAGGTIAAIGAGGITLNSGTIAGGTLTSTAGTFYCNNGTLDGTSAIKSTAAIQVDNNNVLYALGTIANSGVITLDSLGNSTGFIIDSPTLTLTGSGTITTSNEGGDNYFAAASGGEVLDNVGNTFDLSGNFGNGSGLLVINSGIFNADQSNTLNLNTSASFTNTATGQLLATGSGGLEFSSVVVTNEGLIEADSGSSAFFQSGASLTNDSAAGVLTGGTYGAISAGGTATANLAITGAAVVTDAAAIILSGAGSEISFGGTTIETSLKTIDKGASLSVLGNRGYRTKNVIVNNGTVTLGGGVFKAAALNDKSTAVLTGHGTLAAKLIDAGSIVATGGELDLTAKGNTITGTVSGNGTLGFGGTTTLNSGTVLEIGNIALLNKATLNIAAPVSFAGTFDVTGTATLAGAAFTSTGLFEATGKGAGTITDPFASSGTISVAAGDSLAFSGGLANTGLILDSGTFTDTAALTGGSLTLGGSGTAATIASTAGAGNSTFATLTTAGGALNTSGTTLTVTGDYNNTAAGKGNSYNPFAGVTGTIDGQGTKLSVVGVKGTTITTIHGTLTISVEAGHTASFEIENTGASGSAALRGALQTTVNGGSITGTALSGNGVTAGNFGPILAGNASGIYTIAYSGGTLTKEAIHVASDFANVAGLTIDIVAQSGTMAAASPAALSAGLPYLAHEWLGWLPGAHQV